jgi:hypothetical protein
MFYLFEKPVFLRSSWILTCAVSLFLFANFTAGQSPTPTPTPVAQPDAPPPTQPNFAVPVRPMPSSERIGVAIDNQLPLTLEQAIEMALKNNNNIDASRNDSRISDLDLTGARGVYDPLLVSENYYESLTTPTASAIGGAVNGAVTLTRYFGSAGLSGFSPYAGGR